MNKQEIIRQIIAQLANELELLAKAARAAHSEATHESSKAENKYDTRGLEASYLARGQSRQANEIEQAIEQLEAMEVRSYAAQDPIDLGALVELDADGERALYFIAPRAGGTEVTQGKSEVLVITPQSPLGEQLMGRREGEQLQIVIGGRKRTHRLLSVR